MAGQPLPQLVQSDAPVAVAVKAAVKIGMRAACLNLSTCCSLPGMLRLPLLRSTLRGNAACARDEAAWPPGGWKHLPGIYSSPGLTSEAAGPCNIGSSTLPAVPSQQKQNHPPPLEQLLEAVDLLIAQVLRRR